VGTPGYIAPEVLTAYDYSPASDMWAAGVITFIMLSGSPPFYGRNHPEIFDRIRKARWGFNGRNWGQVSENAKDLVKRMLAQNPAERLTAAQIMEHPWIKEYDTQSDAHLADAIEDLKKVGPRGVVEWVAVLSPPACPARVLVTAPPTHQPTHPSAFPLASRSSTRGRSSRARRWRASRERVSRGC
jgi:serine/threonine protein kinase